MKNKKIRAVSISLLLASMLLFASASVYTYYQIQMLGNIKAGLEDPLEAWSESSYIVWQYNSTFFASRNMSTNLIFYLGTNDDHAIQWSIDNCTAHGGTVYVKAATYTGTYNAAVTVKDKVTLVIERGALGITYTVDSGASPTILDYNHYTSDYNYLIFTVGDNYYAQSGTTGAIVYSGTNASAVFTNAINDLPFTSWGNGGGVIRLTAGEFICTSKITITKQIEIIGAGKHKTVLKLPKTPIASIGYFMDIYNFCAIRDIEINGEQAYQTYTINGLRFINGGQELLLENVYLHNFGGEGLLLDGNATVQSQEICLINTMINNCGSNGLHAKCCDVFLVASDIQNNEGDGCVFDGWGSLYIDDCHIGYNGGHGLNLGASDNIVVSNIRAEYNNKSGIRVATVGFTQLINIKVYGSGTSGAWYAGILLDGAQNTTIINAVVGASDYQDFGIKEMPTCDHNTILGCTCYGSQVAQIHTEGANTHVNHSWNGTNWID